MQTSGFKWLYVKKCFRGGKEEDYIKIPVLTNQDIDDISRRFAEDWAESVGGGHVYGWTVYWNIVEYPPKDYFEKEIEETNIEIERARRGLEFKIQYKKILENQMVEGGYV